MNITILNGNSDINNTDFPIYLLKLIKYLNLQKHSVKHFVLRNMKIDFCRGCWGCWVKKPGKCVFTDESEEICEQVINSDLVIFASPVIMGFVDSVLKKTMDKMIPLLHPYIELVKGECHHKKRYSKYPKLALILDRDHDPETDDEDIDITKDLFNRYALNFKAEICFTGFSIESIKEVVHEINNI